MKAMEQFVAVADGTEISTLLVLPDGAPKAVVQLQGAGGLKKEFYRTFAEFLAENGFAVVLFDCRGIGRSTHDFLSSKEADLLDWARLDMTGMLQWTRTRFPGLPVFILGHSIGGIFTGFMDGLMDIRGLALVGACSGDWRRMAFPYRILPAIVFYLYVPWVSKFSRKIPFRIFGVMEDLPRGVAKTWGDLLIDRSYLRKYISRGDTNYDKYSGPLLTLMSDDDPIAVEGTVRQLHSYFEKARGEFRKISPKELGQKKVGHFGFFSRRLKATLWQELLQWLNTNLARKTTGSS